VIAAGSNVWEAKPNLTQLSLCNKNTFDLYSAVATSANGSWTSQGWYSIPAGTCTQVAIGKYSGTLEFYAEYNGGELAWGSGPEQFCVNKSKAFSLAHAEDPSQCGTSDLKMVKVSSMSVAAGMNTINFQPISLDTTLSVCNQTTFQLYGAYALPGSTSGQWRSTGWLSLPPNVCTPRDLGAYKGKLYFYAEYNGGEKYWGNGPVNFCVNKSEAFTIDDSFNASLCSQSIVQKMVPSYELTLVNGTNTLTITP
jgi:uncharacterized membrane protein